MHYQDLTTFNAGAVFWPVL